MNTLIILYRCSECYDHDNKSRKTTIQQFIVIVNIQIKNYTQEANNLLVKC